MAKLNLATITKKFSGESAAWEYLEDLRWPNGPVCPHCGVVGGAYFIKPRNGHRKTSTGKVSYRRLWKCADCRKPFSVLVGTVFERSQVPLSKWLMALFMMAASKNGVAAYELHRTLGVTNKTAWFMMHRLREARKRDPLIDSMTGLITADETFIGGKLSNKHQQGKPGYGGGRGRAGYPKNKTAVLSLVNRTTGAVRSRVVANVNSETIGKAIAEQVNVGGSVLHTDAGAQYRPVGREFVDHQWVDHVRREYVRGTVTSNHAENYFGQLKRSLDGTHHRISKTHLPRYLAEFDFRFTTRKMSDGDRMGLMVSQAAGRRLTYRGTR